MTDHIFKQAASDYERIETVIRYLEKNFRKQPDLKELAERAGLSEFHFQRLFSRWVGISPKRFLQFLTKEHAKHLLQSSGDLLAVAYDSGLSGPGRLHDLFVHCEAVTPGEFKSGGAGIIIRFGIHPTPFGDIMLATTDRGICGLYFISGDTFDLYLDKLHHHWPKARIKENPDSTREVVESIFRRERWQAAKPFRLLLKGTNFQIKVWEALLNIPEGRAVSYESVAQKIGEPLAVRAVGSAVAGNPVSYIIPCHRVIRKEGTFGNYQGGTARKKIILAWESVHAYPQDL
jgi:AraC family transcriptional regulator of adaptative response/methylated-DNA-[protein]-cysteine methyltransferase